MRRFFARAVRRITRDILGHPSRVALELHLSQFERTSELELAGFDFIPARAGVAVDIGANRGTFSLKMLRRFSSVVAFEPNADLAEQLCTFNSNNFKIIESGVSDVAGQAEFYVPVEHGLELDGWGSLNSEHFSKEGNKRVFTIDLVTLDSFELDEVALIKIDVEGHELEAIKGALQTISRCKPTLILEIRDPAQKPISEILTAQGYRCMEPEELFPPHLTKKFEPANFVYVHQELLPVG